MNHINNFFKTFYSVLTFNFYRGPAAESYKLSSAFNYLAGCILLFSLVFSFTAFPLTIFLLKALNTMPSYYPADLQITIDQGKAVSNKNPYVIPMTYGPNNQPRTSGRQPKNFATINTDKKFQLEDYRAADSAIYVASDYFAVMKNNSSAINPGDNVQIQSYTGLKLTLSRATIESFVSTVLSYRVIFFTIIPILFFIGSFLVMLVGTLFTAIFTALLIFGYSKIRSISLRYRTAYILALYAATFSFLVRVLFLLTGTTPFAFFYLVLATLVAIVAIERSHSLAQPQQPAQPQEPDQSLPPENRA